MQSQSASLIAMHRTHFIVALVALGLSAGANATDLSIDGPFSAGVTQVWVTLPDSLPFTATLFYPALSEGTDAPFDSSGGPYPAVTFGHGFFQPVTQYTSTLRHLATHGIIAIASQSEGGIFPNHGNFALDLRRCLTWLEERNADADHFLFGNVETTRFGASGHSMGGGASVLAAAADPRIVALAPLAVANTNPSSISAMSNVSIPVRLIAGSEDTITPLNTIQEPMYANALGARQLVVIQGGFHCGFVEVGSFACDSGSISRDEQLAIVRRQLAEFFLLHLSGQQENWRSVWGPDLPDPAETTVLLDPRIGLVVEPAESDLTAGTTQSLSVKITNLGPATDSFLALVDDLKWSSEFVPSVTRALAPGESETIALEVTATTGADQTALVSVRSMNDDATRTWTVVTLSLGAPTPDLNGDGVVDGADLGILLQSWGTCPACPADLNEDGVVDGADLGILLQSWG